MLFQPEQIQKVLSTFIRIANLTVNTAASISVTSQVTSALSTAGNGGVQVPLQVSTDTNTEGVITSAPTNRALVYDHATQKKLTDANSNEVYGRMTDNGSGAYTLSFYSLVGGAETAYTCNDSIDFEFPYRFTFEHLPADCAIFVMERNVSEDPSNVGPRYADIWELLTITAQNTFNPLTYTPTAATDVTIFANEKAEDGFASGAFTINTTTKAITWSAANAGYNVKTTYRCYAIYKTLLS